MEAIYHEKQQGFICAQHCLNNLLQGPYFTAIDLSDIAHKLDEQERNALGVSSSREACFNNDETGFFSVQVIFQALKNLDLEVVPLLSKNPKAQSAKEFPAEQSAFICNYQQHWFAIRKLGYQWFNLNSMLPRPTLISDTYLSLYLTQLCNEGHSIYVVVGVLPECEVDTYLRANPVSQAYPGKERASLAPHTASDNEDNDELLKALEISLQEEDAQDPCLQKLLLDTGKQFEEEDIGKAMKFSLQETIHMPHANDTNEDNELRAAIALSLQGNSSREDQLRSDKNLEDLRAKRQAHFSKNT